MVQVAPSQRSFITGHIPEGQGKRYVDDGDVACCVCTMQHACTHDGGGVCLCVQHWMHYHGIMKKRGAHCMF